MLPEIYHNQKTSKVLYERDADKIVISLRGMTNHEIRDFMVGLWARLDRDDQVDFVESLRHYLQKGSVMPYVARCIRDADAQVIH